jgi:putative FmdB family regulatory protein
MPTYTYICNKCEKKFELFASFSDYKEHPKCQHCSAKNTDRSYEDDVINVSCSIKKHSSELKTLGDLANRNRDSLSDDQRMSLHEKHNSYKDPEEIANLPKGMSQIKKPKTKTKWTKE